MYTTLRERLFDERHAWVWIPLISGLLLDILCLLLTLPLSASSTNSLSHVEYPSLFVNHIAMWTVWHWCLKVIHRHPLIGYDIWWKFEFGRGWGDSGGMKRSRWGRGLIIGQTWYRSPSYCPSDLLVSPLLFPPKVPHRHTNWLDYLQSNDLSVTDLHWFAKFTPRNPLCNPQLSTQVSSQTGLVTLSFVPVFPRSYFEPEDIFGIHSYIVAALSSFPLPTAIPSLYEQRIITSLSESSILSCRSHCVGTIYPAMKRRAVARNFCCYRRLFQVASVGFGAILLSYDGPVSIYKLLPVLISCVSVADLESSPFGILFWLSGTWDSWISSLRWYPSVNRSYLQRCWCRSMGRASLRDLN